MNIIRITKEEEFLQLESIWDELLKRSNNELPFLSFTWQKNYWRYFSNNKELFVLLIKDNNEVIGIAPFYKSKLTKSLQLLGTGLSDYLGLIFDKEKEEEGLTALFHYLTTNSNLFTLIDLHQNCNPHLILTTNNYFLIKELLQDVSPYIELPDNHNTFLENLGRKTRQHLRYYERVINKNFNMEFKTIDNKDSIDNLMEALFYLHKKRWQKKKFLPGMFYSKRIRAFHRAVAKELFEKNMLNVYYLVLNDKIEAIIYGFSAAKKFYYYLGGFNPNLAKYSLGSVLINLTIKDLISKRYTEFDFLRGREDYKYRFGGKDRENYRILIYKDTFTAKLLLKVITKIQYLTDKLKERLH